MYKNLVVKFFVLIFIFFSIIVSVDAANIKVLKRNDIVIGNTLFKSGTWVSASRAAIAGSLYTKNTGRTDVKTYLYINSNLIYMYDLNTESYKLLKSNEIAQLEVEMNIYYENNVAINNTYESRYELEIDEETGNEYVVNSNPVYDFFTYFSNSTIELNDDKVQLDYVNKTITCPYNYVFDFNVIIEEDPNINESATYEYKGICGLSDFEFESKIWYDLEPVKIENIELVNSNLEPELINQNKLKYSSFEGYFYSSFNVDITILEALDSFLIEDYYYFGNNKYIAFDIKFNENNVCDHYSVVSESGVRYISECISDDTMRFYLIINDYYIGSYFTEPFLIVDRVHNIYERISFSIDGSEVKDTISYVWGEDVDSAGQQYLYLVDSSGNKVSGYVYVTYDNTDYEIELYVDEDGYLLVPDLVTINSIVKIEEGVY